IGVYESRYISITGTLAAAPASAGTGFVSAQINTTGTSGNNLLRFRVPATLASQYDLALGCTVSATAPMWRFTTQAQPSAWAQADINSVSCPAPKVTGATVNSATQVTVTFDRTISAASVMANGSQFTFNNGLTATAATVSGKTVVLTTSTQTGGVSYTVTVASTVTDVLGTPVSASAASATFTGYATAAVLQLTEIMPNINSSHDLVELVAVQGGFVGGMKLYQDSITTLATLPNVTVNTGDIIVVHLVPAGTTGIAPGNDSTAKNQYAAATYSANYDGAWDFLGGTSGITLSSRTIRILSATGTIQDAIAATTNSAPPASFGPSIRQIQAVGQWLPADCSGSPCDQTTGMAISAIWNGTATTPTGNSLRRASGTDTNKKEDWAVGANSIGTANP
ncbi:MAG TPA: Ig-like domain-containing protein, partial [Longimicrobium sp.]